MLIFLKCVTGHEDVLRTGNGRIWVECLVCGRQSPGITVERGD